MVIWKYFPARYKHLIFPKALPLKKIRWLSSTYLPLRTKRIGDVLTTWQKRLLTQSTLSEPTLSVEYIVAHALGKKTLYYTNLDDELTDSEIAQIEKMCTLCQTGMPVQYVLGEWDFRDLTVKLKPPVLIPRPETEELADLCSLSLRELEKGLLRVLPQSKRFLELGCGSGALTVCILKKFKQMKAVVVDISKDACDLTSENAKVYGVEDRLTVIHGDFTSEHVISKLKSNGLFCLLVSNPPYVTTEEMEHLQPEIKMFEDPVALHGGEDGLDLVKIVLQRAPGLLVPGGHVWLEVGLDHPEVIRQMVAQDAQYQALHYTETALDFTGRGRFCHLTTSAKQRLKR